MELIGVPTIAAPDAAPPRATEPDDPATTAAAAVFAALLTDLLAPPPVITTATPDEPEASMPVGSATGQLASLSEQGGDITAPLLDHRPEPGALVTTDAHDPLPVTSAASAPPSGPAQVDGVGQAPAHHGQVLREPDGAEGLPVATRVPTEIPTEPPMPPVDPTPTTTAEPAGDGAPVAPRPPSSVLPPATPAAVRRDDAGAHPDDTVPPATTHSIQHEVAAPTTSASAPAPRELERRPDALTSPAGATGAPQEVRATAPVLNVDAPTAPPRAESPVVDQLVDHLTELTAQRVDGDHEITVQLDPADLGRVELRVRLQDDLVHVHLDAHERPTAELVRQHVQELRSALEAAGMPTGGIDVGQHELGSRSQMERPATRPEPPEPDRRPDAPDRPSRMPVASDRAVDLLL